MNRLPLVLIVLLGASLLSGCGARPPSQAELDLQQIQGRWVFKRGNREVVKIIDGDRENVTYAHKGRMMSVHVAQISVSRSQTGARVLKWSDLRSVAGRKPQEGAETSGEYMYNCDGDRLVEFQGVVGELGAPDALIWRRDTTANPTPDKGQAKQPRVTGSHHTKVRTKKRTRPRTKKRARVRRKKKRKSANTTRDRTLASRERALQRREEDLKASFRDLNAREQRLSERRVTKGRGALGGRSKPAKTAPSREERERDEAAQDDAYRRDAERQVSAETPRRVQAPVGDQIEERDETPEGSQDQSIAPLKPKKARRARSRAEKLATPAG